jgi:DNA-binding beta-propeller fold protein YncE
VITNDSNTLIAADKGNNQVRFIDVSIDNMSIIANVWVGSEPGSLELTADGQYLLAGLQGASSVAVVSVLDMELLGSIQLDDDGVYDIEYINSTDQLIVSFVASNPTYNKTKLYDLDNWTNFIATPSTVQIGNTTVTIEDDYAGFISISDDEEFVYIIDRFGGIDRVYKYYISGDWLSPESYSAIVGVISSFHDIEFVPNFGIVTAVGGMDAFGEEDLDHASVYNLDDLSHIANFGIGSTPLALAYDSIGEHLYISPTDVDDNGMFVIEYNIQTQLQTNYYQVAGRLGSHALVVDSQGQYIYAAVDDLSDQDTDEPYNNSSFNIQKIKILPEGTYDAINNFE